MFSQYCPIPGQRPSLSYSTPPFDSPTNFLFASWPPQTSLSVIYPDHLATFFVPVSASIFRLPLFIDICTLAGMLALHIKLDFMFVSSSNKCTPWPPIIGNLLYILLNMS